ncbi:hypothetical protein PR202_ga00126 [Eleusine coracana subsp. coracana]|uniref:Gamma-cystathionase n=1 Tax=Eleusine coracana subsp. coracana TaxID=191504 RepID=A0AAV5BCP3_ELECO|nr:hypothetical protein PR202_ga00126 [Eleusine coracana subsp. coracana]
MGKMGSIRSTFIDIDQDMESSLKDVLDQSDDVTLFYADSPTNPMLKCLDIRQIAELCHRKGVLVCIDSTLASPINQKPLTLGADLVLHSATKYMAGHHDVIAGCVSASEVLISKVRAWHNDLGGAISPNAAYMIIRADLKKTMALRVEASNRTALLMARLLEAHPKIERVHYPGLESSPCTAPCRQHPDDRLWWCGQLRGKGRPAWNHEVYRRVGDTVHRATSLGGCESLVQQPAVMSFWGHTDARTRPTMGSGTTL